MKEGFCQIILRVLFSAILLFPNICMAGHIIPGLYGGVVPTSAISGSQVSKSNFPGFYGGSVKPPPSNALPQLQSGGIVQGASVGDPTDTNNKLTVHQNQSYAIIDWSKFDIGADAWVSFDQKGNASWTALNRIWDLNPSLIFGRLTADGNIYLINQNGILFGRGSKVNVNSLVGSANNIKNSDFLNNSLNFNLENYEGITNPDPLAVVSNQGEIYVNDGGYVFLIGPRVENLGIINAPIGQIGLAAGTIISVVSPAETDSRSFYYIIIGDDFKNNPKSSDSTFGKTVNGPSMQWDDGRWTGLYADGGMVGMYGATVEHWGVIRSMTAFRNKQGQVELKAADKVTTGGNSNIILPVDDSLDSDTGQLRTVSDTFNIQPTVFIGGLDQLVGGSIVTGRSSNQIEIRGSITAPAGDVRLSANDRVYLETNSSIDVSGVVADLPLAIIPGFKLTSVELRDAYSQKQGVVPGLKVTAPLVYGSAIGDLSAAILSQDRTAIERSIGGVMRKITETKDGKEYLSYDTQTGIVNIQAGNDIIVKQGAFLDFSGGWINYGGGFVDTTKLLSGTKIYSISNAPSNIHYDRILGQFEKRYDKFGIVDKFSGLYYGGGSPLRSYVNGYTVGGDAGQLTLSAPAIVLDGRLTGGVRQGTYQNTWTMSGSFTGMNANSDYSDALILSKATGHEAPKAGSVILDGVSSSAANPTSISIISETKPLPEDFTSFTSLPTNSLNEISAQILNNANLGTLVIAANLAVSVSPEVTLNLKPGGSLSVQARRIDQEGAINVPGGSISMIIGQNLTSFGGVDGKFGASNPNPNYVPLEERIIIGPKSRLDTSGEKIDNRLLGKNGNPIIGPALTTGGSISLKDETDMGSGVFIQPGAVVDVSGGYSVAPKGIVTGGNAGVLSIQGLNIMLDGDLRGYALADLNGKILGGSITLASREIHVAPNGLDWSAFNPQSDRVASDRNGILYLAANRFDNTGFTQIKLNSINDLFIEKDTTIVTSMVRLNDTPSAGQSVYSVPTLGRALNGRSDLLMLDDSMAVMAGPSLFAANAGMPFDGNGAYFTGNLRLTAGGGATLTISPGATVCTAPAGISVTRIANDVAVNPSPVHTQISLSALSVEMAGTLESPGGNISISSQGDLHIQNGAQILANGFNLPDPASTPKGFALNYQPVSGGSISLSASGSLILDRGSLIDISGSDARENSMRFSNGTINAFRVAGNPGNLTLTYGSNLSWNGAVNASKDPSVAGIGGAALAVNMTDTNNSLNLKAADIIKYIDMGFDDLTFRSRSSLIISDGINANIGRKLTLDAPVIQGGKQDAALSAPWILLTNTYYPSAQPPSEPAIGGANINFYGQWLDVIGAIQFIGFQNVSMKAAKDIRLSEALYNLNNTDMPGKMLTTNGNLILDADRIYPGNFYSYAKGSAIYPNIYSDYILHADGMVTIQHTDINGNAVTQHSFEPIYSAGGTLRVEGLKGIDVENGYLAAPLGTITLTTAVNGNNPAPQSRIYLSSGSVLTTAGNTEVSYGGIDSSNIWVTQDKESLNNLSGGLDDISTKPVSQYGLAPKSITLNADEVIAMKGSSIDVSGGGSVFAYKFQAGLEGSIDPLIKANRYVVFKDNGFQMPGAAIYLQGSGMLSEGQYTLFPLDANNPQNARYAFMPGAYILEAQTGSVIPLQGSVSKDGYPLIVGYSAVADTTIRSTQPKVYTLRTAADVLNAEGNYVKPDALVAGDGGGITMTGNTTIIEGVLRAAALNNNYSGGKIDLSGTNVIVQPTASVPLSNFTFGTGFNSRDDLKGYIGKVAVSAEGISGNGFSEVSLGNVNTTGTVTIQSGVILEAPVITLTAKDAITIQPGSQLHAMTSKAEDSGEGVISLSTPGNLLIDADATVHATHNISLNVNNVDDIRGSLVVDNSAILLKSSNIFFGTAGPTGVRKVQDDGLYLTTDTWNRFTGFQDIALVSQNDIQFRDNFTISAIRSLTLDAQRIVNMSTNGSGVTVAAPTVNIMNSGASSIAPAISNTGYFAVKDVGKISVDQINIGRGDVLFDGFSGIILKGHGDVTFTGAGSLTTGNSDLQINAARITAGPYRKPDGTYQAANFHVYTGSNYYNDFGFNSTRPFSNAYNSNPVGVITITNSGGSPGTLSALGGILEFWGKAIFNGTVRSDGTINENGTIIQVNGGEITLVAKGNGSTDGIFMREGAQLLASGTAEAPGGQITLQANNGIVLDSGSMINVSAGVQGDAGTVTLSAPTGGVTFGGNLFALAKGGVSGSFVLDTHQLLDADVSGLIGTLASGDFSYSIDLRSRIGNINVASMLKARHIKLTADDPATAMGQINIFGKLDSSAYPGGLVELYANNDLNIQGTILAQGTSKGEENVILSSASGFVNLQNTGAIDFPVTRIGQGMVHIRAQQSGNDVLMKLDGAITGASAVYAEAVRLYDVSNIGPNEIAGWQKDTQLYMTNNADAIKARLLGNPGLANLDFHFLPGVELRSTGNITLNTTWDLSNQAIGQNAWRYGGESGYLTIRAGGNLNINYNLVDHPSSFSSLTASSSRDSWGLNLVAGADIKTANGTEQAGADYLAVIKGRMDQTGQIVGNFKIADQVVVYTESAPIRFASAGDMLIGAGLNRPGYMINPSMSYNLASYYGSIQGNVGRDLVVNGGAIQSAVGDIDIHVGRDLQLNYDAGSKLGAIRTTGILPLVFDSTAGQYVPVAFGSDPKDPIPIDPLGRTFTQLDPNGTYYWRYVQGGDVTLDVGRYIGYLNSSVSSAQWKTAQDNNAWDSFNPIRVTFSTAPSPGQRVKTYGLFSADYYDGTGGLATMGGGDLNVRAGGDFFAQAGTFGDGNLSIYSGGDVKGRFLNHGSVDKAGRANISAMGNFGSDTEPVQIELFNSQMAVMAQGEIQIGAVLNPSLASNKADIYRNTSFVYSTYAEDTSISLKAGTDVTIVGKSPIYKSTTSGDDAKRVLNETVLPPTVEVDASGNVVLMNSFTLASSPTGNLILQAGGDVTGQYIYAGNVQTAKILMSDIAPENWYGLFYVGGTRQEQQGGWLNLMTMNNHGLYNAADNTWTLTKPVHQDDGQAVKIHADGDVRDLRLVLPKMAEVSAGRDILDITYEGQNVNLSDLSKIQAGRNISMQYIKASVTSSTTDAQPHDGMIQGGPGVFIVQAGGTIDLGSLQDGIQTIGNGGNQELSTDKSSLIVVSGYTFNKTVDNVGAFFDKIRQAGDDYSKLLSAGNVGDAGNLLRTTRQDTIVPFLGTPSGTGDINMTSSQIATSIGRSDIFVIANGNLNLGKTSLPTSSTTNAKTGITASGGGNINIFSRGDMNVNESRIMTFFSRQDVLSDTATYGDITVWSDQGNINAGRGSRTAVSAQPPRKVRTTGGGYVWVFTPPAIGSGIRAVVYGDNPPPPGNIHLFAPGGIIDAGEAGIAGNNVILAALTVNNATNITFATGSVGVPQAATGTTTLGALTGAGAVTPGSQMTSDASGIAAGRAQAAKMIDDIMPKWLDVKVIDFVENE